MDTQPINDGINQNPAEPPAGAKNTETPPADEIMIPKSRFDEINQRLKAMEKERAAEAARAAQAEAKQAEEQGKFKELYEKTSQQLAEAQAAVKAAELFRIKSEIAARLRLPAALADRLRGETAEELEADAKALLEAFPAQPAPSRAGQAPFNPQGGQETLTDAERVARLNRQRGVGVTPF